ncbi:MAG: class I SAM-dependent methyltransferase [Acidobacteriota bacterium]
MGEEINPDVVREYERETWSRCAGGYLDTFAALTRETVPLLVEGAQIGSGSRVLEIGSGPGHVARALTESGATVTGVDFSPQMVKVARRRFPEITFREADAEQLPFNAGSFDAVVSNFTVHHLARPEVAFREASRVLVSGGRFAFVVWGSPEVQSSIAAFFAAVQAHHTLDELPHGPLFGVTDRSVYERMLAAAGLKGCRLTTHEVVWRCETLEPVLRGFWDWGNMAALSQEVQDRIETATRENAKPFGRDGHYAFPHTVLLGRAMKP